MSGYDAAKVVECMFDPVTSEVLAKLEDGPKDLSKLAGESGLTADEVLGRLSYLVEHGFVTSRAEGGAVMVAANGDKLASAVEGSDSFDGAVDSITTLDSYLN
jgi:hypothetical protein